MDFNCYLLRCDSCFDEFILRCRYMHLISVLLKMCRCHIYVFSLVKNIYLYHFVENIEYWQSNVSSFKFVANVLILRHSPMTEEWLFERNRELQYYAVQFKVPLSDISTHKISQPEGCWNIGYLNETHFKFNSREISSAPNLSRLCPIVFKLCYEHGNITAVLVHS